MTRPHPQEDTAKNGNDGLGKTQSNKSFKGRLKAYKYWLEKVLAELAFSG